MLHLGPVNILNPLILCIYTQAFTSGILHILDYGHWAYVQQSIPFAHAARVYKGKHSQFEMRGAEMCLAGAYLAGKKTNLQIILSYFCPGWSEQHSFTVWPLGMPAQAAATEQQPKSPAHRWELVSGKLNQSN